MKPIRATILAALLGVASFLSAAPGELDPVFRAGIGVGLTPSGYPTFDNGTGAVNAVALQSDGRILAGGNISRFNNAGALTALKRLNADGTLDATFNPGGAGLGVTSGQPEVNALLVAPDDSIYVGGTFQTYNGTARGGFARLNADGTLDQTFAFSALSGTVRYVAAIARQADGKVIIGGAFTAVNGIGRINLARLNVDGSVDTTFVPAGYTTNGGIRALAVGPDGFVYVGGTTYNPTTQRNDAILHRLRPDGSRDMAFNPVFAADYASINALLLLPDGRVVAGGDLPLPGHASHLPLAAFTATGAVDTAFVNAFASGTSNGGVLALALSSDGRILAGGIFTLFGGASRASIVRLNLDGTVDPSLAPAPYAPRESGYLTHLYAFAVQPDGRIVAGGWLNRVTDPNVETYNLVRFEGDFTNGPGTVALTSAGYTVNENAGPALLTVARFAGLVGTVSVDYAISPGTATTDDFTPVTGTLTWASGEGGSKTISVPITNDTVAESLEGAVITLSNLTGGATLGTALGALGIRDDDSLPAIVLQPIAVTLDQGETFSLVVGFDSVLPATVQWYRGTDQISGAILPVYTVNAADPALHNGGYSVRVTNANGTTPSATVTVTVNIPAGAVATGFTPTHSLTSVWSSGFDPAGNLLIAGANGVIRVSSAGVVDTSFALLFNGLVVSVVPLPDGSLLAGGSFTSVGGTARNYFAHVNADGSLDQAVNLNLTQLVNVMSLGSGDKLYVGHGGSQGLKRFTLAGTADATFAATTVATGTSGMVYNVKERADGKVFVSHQTGSAGSVAYRFQLLTSTGAVDSSFTAPTLNWNVYDWDILPDGRIVIVGRFSTVNGVTSRGIAVLQPDGTLDSSFDFANAFTGPVNGVRYVNGRLLAWGSFTAVHGVAQTGIARLNPDGTRDTTFKVNAGASAAVNTTLTFPDGRLFLGGSFSSVRGVSRNRVAVLEAGPGAVGLLPLQTTVVEGAGTVNLLVKRYAPATGTLAVDYSTVAGTALAPGDFTALSGTLTWGAGDVSDRVLSIPLTNDATGEPAESFQVSLNAASLVGDATLAGGTAVIAVTDDDNPPAIVTPPQTQTVAQGATTTFAVTATSTPAATYRWTFNGSDLADGSGISGSGTATLTITNTGPEHIGAYRVRLTNTNGSTTSASADLLVNLNPAFKDYQWPGNLTVNNRVNVILPLPDGGAYVGGRFTHFAGQTGRSYLVRLAANGAVDTTFSPAPNGGVLDLRLAGNVLYVLSDPVSPLSQIGGGAAVGGFAAIDATTGARQSTFMTNLGTGGNSTVRALALFPDGDVLLAGDFTSFNSNTAHRYVARLNADGTLHAPFSTASATGSSSVVTAADVGPDGKIVLGGTTISYGGATRFLRLNGDGSRDAAFAPANATSATFTRLRVLADGRIMATGTALPGGNRVITRVSATGEWSSTEFFGQTSGTFNDFALQRNGRTIGVGNFSFVRQPTGSGSVSHVSRFDATGNYEGTWPTGVGFDNTAVAVALAEDGRIWIGGDFTAYNGTAIQRLIRLNGDAIPIGITLQPRSQELNPGQTAVFESRATGTSALTYQWRKGGVPLADDGRISGATTAVLTVANVGEADEGQYTLRVTNLAGEDISNAAALTVLGSPEILTEPAASLTAFSNRTYSLEVSTRGIAPLTFQWRRNGVNLVEGANGITGTNTGRLVFANLGAGDAGLYDVVVTNGSGSVTSTTFSLAVDPHPVDRHPTFSSVVGTNPTTIYTILNLPDGGALVGGTFNSIQGASATSSAGRIARVLPNGQVAALPFTVNGDVRSMAIQPDGKIIIGGMFTSLTPTGQSSVSRNRLARLNADFTFDPSFDVGAGPASEVVSALKVDALGRIYAAGSFPSWGGRPSGRYLVRLRPDGSIDPSWDSPMPNNVNDLEFDSAGRLYAGGLFTAYQGGNYLVRLNADGTRDTTYASPLSGAVLDLAIQADDKILAVVSATGLRRLTTAGALDPAFPALNQTGVGGVAVQADGKILVAGSFTSYGTYTRGNLIRLNADGTLDPVIEVLGTGSGGVLRVDGYGRIWVGGSFTVFNNIVTNVRGLYVMNGDTLPLAFVQEPSARAVEAGQAAGFAVVATGTSAISYRWLRNGVELSDGPGISGATTANLSFAAVQPADAANYSVRITNAAGTRTSAAAALVVLGLPEVVLPPAAQTLEVGQTASFFVQARGAGTLGYQWLRNGSPLTNGGNVSGATSPSLTLTNLALNDAGGISVRVTGSAGSTTTSPVVLTISLNPAGVARTLTLPTFNSTVSALLPLADGSFFAGGAFTTVTWTGGSAARNRFAKINANGSADTAWPTFNAQVYAIARDSSGRVYVGGGFTSVVQAVGGTVTRNRLVRLNADGTLDTAFNAPGGVAGAGPSGLVKGIKIDGAGRVYIYGEFASYNGVAANYVARLNEDGSRDTTFTSATNSFVYDVEFAADGRIWIGHGGTWSGQSRLVLVDGTGTRDAGFTYAGSLTAQGIALRSDGSVLNLSTGYPYLQKVGVNGATDANYPNTDTFHQGPGNQVTVHAEGGGDQVYLHGSFTSYGTVASPNIIRINADGSRDTTFDVATGFNGTVDTMVVDGQGRLWVGGSFISYNGDASLARFVVLNGGTAQTNSGPPADTLVNFLTTAGVPADKRGPADDPDGDGLSNLLEYALDLNPAAADPANHPTVATAGDRLNFAYRRARGDVTYVVETTTNLADVNSWTTTGVDQGTPDGSGNTVASIPLTGAAHFLRLKVVR